MYFVTGFNQISKYFPLTAGMAESEQFSQELDIYWVLGVSVA